MNLHLAQQIISALLHEEPGRNIGRLALIWNDGLLQAVINLPDGSPSSVLKAARRVCEPDELLLVHESSPVQAADIKWQADLQALAEPDGIAASLMAWHNGRLYSVPEKATA